MQIIANLHIDMKFILLGIFFVGHIKKIPYLCIGKQERVNI